MVDGVLQAVALSLDTPDLDDVDAGRAVGVAGVGLQLVGAGAGVHVLDRHQRGSS
jgi:hypothetical protein